jgi:hypothetical protein
MANGRAAISEIEKKKRILGWISEDNAQETYRRKLQERQPGTGNWFLESKAFQEWLGGGGKSLWCPGIRKLGFITQQEATADALNSGCRQNDSRVSSAVHREIWLI